MLKYLDELEELTVRVSQEAALISDNQTDLVGAFARIIGDCGVCRETGMVIANNVPSLESVTPNEFTLFPTQTNINVAVEGFWSGITEGITKVFELIFELIFGVIKLLVKPFEWLFGSGGGKSDSSGGATSAAESKVEAMGEPEVIRAVTEAPKDTITEITTDVVHDLTVSDWDMRTIKNPDLGLFNDINQNIGDIYKLMLSSTEDFIKAFDSLKGGEAFYSTHMALSNVTSSSSVAISNVSIKFFKSLYKQLGIASPNIKDTADVVKYYGTLEERVRENEGVKVDSKLVVQFFSNNLLSMREYVKTLEETLNFAKSDEELYKSLDSYTSRFERQQDKVGKLSSTDFKALGLKPDEISDVKLTINLQMKAIKLAINAVRAQSMISIKGKRAIFKGINITDRITKQTLKHIKAGKTVNV